MQSRYTGHDVGTNCELHHVEARLRKLAGRREKHGQIHICSIHIRYKNNGNKVLGTAVGILIKIHSSMKNSCLLQCNVL